MFEVITLALDMALLVVAIWLARILVGSPFVIISAYLIVLAVALTIHSAVDVFLGGSSGFFLYGVTALLASLSYLLLVYGVYQALKKIARGGEG